MIQLGAIIFPGCIHRHRSENGLRLWVDGNPTDPNTASAAAARFQTVLGVLRAWRSGAGELVDERRAGLGVGPVRDEAGTHWVMAGPAIAYGIVGGEIEQLAFEARSGIAKSDHLRNALWLNGRASRTAADFYMIHEYAEREFGGAKGITSSLGISGNAQSRLTQSANSLSPLEGGRHAKFDAPAPLTLDDQREFVANLLRRWLARYRGDQPART
jgi:hypothetical protein